MTSGKWIGRLRAHWFALMMGLLIAAAWAWPQAHRWINPHDVTKFGAISLVFLMLGITLPTEEATRAATRWRIHLFVQGFCFVFLPLACWLILLPWRERLPEGLVIGFYLLAAMPTTITSCVVYTQLSGGNTPAAIFNAIFGNLAGVFISPTLLLLMIGAVDIALDLDTGAILAKLSLIVIVPFAAGHVLYHLSRGRTTRWRPATAPIGSSCILLIIYLAFCRVFSTPSLAAMVPTLLVPLLLILPAHLIVLGLVGFGGRAFGFSRPDRIALLYCAPQKTLSLGLPMIAACLAARPELIGLASLPLIVYHALQMLVSGLLKEWLKARRGVT